MKLDIKRPIMNLVAKSPFLVEEGSDRPMTIGLVIMQSLLGGLPDDDKLSADKKTTHFRLAMKIDTAMTSDEEEVDISAEELAEIKTRVGRMYPSHIAGQVCLIIEGEL